MNAISSEPRRDAWLFQRGLVASLGFGPRVFPMRFAPGRLMARCVAASPTRGAIPTLADGQSSG